MPRSELEGRQPPLRVLDYEQRMRCASVELSGVLKNLTVLSALLQPAKPPTRHRTGR